MSAEDRVERLRAELSAAEAESALESALAEAKAARRADPDDPVAKERARVVASELAALRQARRADSVAIGGDAVRVEEV